MSLLALILGAVMSGSTVIEYGKQPLDEGLVGQLPTQHIQHLWYSSDDYRQAIVQRAYDLWWMDFVIMIECESWFNPNARWDNWHAHGLCQMSDLYHKIPKEYYSDAYFQIDYCFAKRKSWTRFYWPSRIIKWKKCYNYVSDRFILES